MKLSTLKNVALAATLAAIPAVPAHAGLVITPAPGFAINLLNEGNFFNNTNVFTVPDNLALATHGSVAFSDGQLGAEFSLPIHFTPALNDGAYGNTHSWISDTASSVAKPDQAGIRFLEPTALTSVAWGRDNGGDSSIDCCGGQLTDRSLGVYTLQFTTVLHADSNTPNSNWTTIGTFDYQSADDTVIGGGFTPWFRHQYSISFNSLPVVAESFRILVPFGGIALGTDIDEIEAFGHTVPEPTSMGLMGLAALALVRRTRRA